MKHKVKDFSIINKELTVDGTVSTRGKLIIKGIAKGTITGEDIVIAEEGSVYANAKVSSMTIGGTFEGEINASKELIVLSTGKCTGKIVCKDLIVEAGAVLNAQITYLDTNDLESEGQNIEKCNRQ